MEMLAGHLCVYSFCLCSLLYLERMCNKLSYGWLDGSLISGLNDDGDKAVFLGGCKESVKLICGMLTEVSVDEE